MPFSVREWLRFTKNSPSTRNSLLFLTFFLSAERLSSHMSIHKMYKCAVSQCDKVSFGVYIESFFSLEKYFKVEFSSTVVSYVMCVF